MRLVISVVLGLAPLCASAVAQKASEATFPPKQIEAGAEIYATNCATCHGNRMKNPPWAIDLATVPKNDHRRFVESVTNGRNNMPPWGNVLRIPRMSRRCGPIFRPEKSRLMARAG